MTNDLNALRYPIGTYTVPTLITPEIIEAWIKDIELFPSRLNELVESLDPQDLLTTYRPGGWSIAQLVHHCCDSHTNSWTRFRLALTEENPTIRPYFEDRWARLPDSVSIDIADSLNMIKYLHAKWVRMLRNIQSNELKRTLEHPEYGEQIAIDAYIGNYAWHCNHHLAHIKLALQNLKASN